MSSLCSSVCEADWVMSRAGALPVCLLSVRPCVSLYALAVWLSLAASCVRFKGMTGCMLLMSDVGDGPTVHARDRNERESHRKWWGAAGCPNLATVLPRELRRAAWACISR